MKICFLAASNSIHSHQWINFFSNLGHKIIWISLVPSTIKVTDNIEYYEFTSGIFSSIFKENQKSLFVTPQAKYIDVATSDGRMPPKELIYMSEVYDMYIFLRRFEMTYKNILIYAWSMFGRIIYNIIRILIRYPKNIKLILDCLYAPVYVLLNFSKIKKGNLNFFNKTLT